MEFFDPIVYPPPKILVDVSARLTLQEGMTDYAPEENRHFADGPVEHAAWDDHVEEETVFVLWTVVARREHGGPCEGGVTAGAFAAGVDFAAVDERRLGKTETEVAGGRAGEADVGECVGVVGLLCGGC